MWRTRPLATTNAMAASGCAREDGRHQRARVVGVAGRRIAAAVSSTQPAPQPLTPAAPGATAPAPRQRGQMPSTNPTGRGAGQPCRRRRCTTRCSTTTRLAVSSSPCGLSELHPSVPADDQSRGGAIVHRPLAYAQVSGKPAQDEFQKVITDYPQSPRCRPRTIRPTFSTE